MKRWCAECRSRQAIEDVSTEGYYAHGREYAIRVEWLTCGHYAEGDHYDAGPGPGAPEPLPRSWTLAKEAHARELVSPTW